MLPLWLRSKCRAYWVLAFLFGVARAAAVLWFSRLFGQVGAVLGYALREEHIEILACQLGKDAFSGPASCVKGLVNTLY